MLKHSLKIVVVSLSAFFCLSGQVARKDVQEIPSTQCAANEIELEKEESVKQQPKRKGAAKRSMEDNGQRTIVRKSAAKRSMERVD